MAEQVLPALSEAKVQSRFDELPDRAERAELFIIIRDGRPVAKFGPPRPCGDRWLAAGDTWPDR